MISLTGFYAFIKKNIFTKFIIKIVKNYTINSLTSLLNIRSIQYFST